MEAAGRGGGKAGGAAAAAWGREARARRARLITRKRCEVKRSRSALSMYSSAMTRSSGSIGLAMLSLIRSSDRRFYRYQSSSDTRF